MATDSLEIGSIMCDRAVKLVEAGKGTDAIQEYFSTHKALYDSMLRSGVKRSQNDWEMEKRQFEESLEDEDGD